MKFFLVTSTGNGCGHIASGVPYGVLGAERGVAARLYRIVCVEIFSGDFKLLISNHSTKISGKARDTANRPRTFRSFVSSLSNAPITHMTRGPFSVQHTLHPAAYICPIPQQRVLIILPGPNQEVLAAVV